MKKVCLHIVIISLTIIFYVSAFAATEILGKITAKRGDSVEVTFEPNETVAPKAGDAVSFSKEIPGTGGLKAKAGEGTVTEVNDTTVWVKTSDSRPNLKMDAFIMATGIPAPKPVGYILNLNLGQQFEWQGKTYWSPNVYMKFTYPGKLKVSPEPINPIQIEFPSGACFASARLRTEKTVAANCKTALEEDVKYQKEYGVDVGVVWREKTIQGKNAAYCVSQIRYKAWLDSPRLKQEFLITGESPTPPPDHRALLKAYWTVRFIVPDYVDKQFSAEYWEKVVLDILQSSSVELKK